MTWTGARIVAARPVAPWPSRIGVARSASTNSSSIRWLALKMKLFRSLIVLVDHTAIGSGELDRVAHDGAEHGLEIQSRADRLADFAQRFQFPNRPRQLARPRLQFLEQPHVLDGDHCLVGEGFEQLDLFVGERSNLRSTNQNTPMGSPSR